MTAFVTRYGVKAQLLWCDSSSTRAKDKRRNYYEWRSRSDGICDRPLMCDNAAARVFCFVNPKFSTTQPHPHHHLHHPTTPSSPPPPPVEAHVEDRLVILCRVLVANRHVEEEAGQVSDFIQGLVLILCVCHFLTSRCVHGCLCLWQTVSVWRIVGCVCCLWMHVLSLHVLCNELHSLCGLDGRSCSYTCLYQSLKCVDSLYLGESSEYPWNTSQGLYQCWAEGLWAALPHSCERDRK